jgi:thioester reductase-like protein
LRLPNVVSDGDLTDVTLGLGEDKFTWLSNWASVIFHVGARVNVRPVSFHTSIEET